MLGLTFLRCAAEQSLERSIEVIEGGAALLLLRLKTAFEKMPAFQRQVEEIRKEAEEALCSLNSSLYRQKVFEFKSRQNVETQKKRKQRSDELSDIREAKCGKKIPLPEYPEEFVCPIGGEPFIDPVVTEDGHTYERVVLERWLEEKKTSPMTNLPLKTTAVVPNIALRKSIEKWEEIAHEFAINANS